jgi:hypothetical protein
MLAGTPEGKMPVRNLVENGRIILNWILKEIMFEDMDLFHLHQDSIQWWALVNMVMRICVP